MVKVTGESSTRKWYVLECLNKLNTTEFGEILPKGIERIIKRLATPQEYRNNVTMLRPVIEFLNLTLKTEGVEVAVCGTEPLIRSVTAAIPSSKRPMPQEEPPDFLKLVTDSNFAEILKLRWIESQKCVDAEAYLAAIVMMGSILEGVLLEKVELNLQKACTTKSVPFDKKNNKPKPIHEWGLYGLIEVAHEIGWLQGDMKRFSHSLRESRNIVHPYVQRNLNEFPDKDTCAISWQVVRAGVADLLNWERN
jgi:hypothetical protein